MTNINLRSILQQSQKFQTQTNALIVIFCTLIKVFTRDLLLRCLKGIKLNNFYARLCAGLAIFVLSSSVLIGQAPWSLTKTGPSSVESGQCFTYELIYECSDLFADCDNIILVDTISSGLTFDSSIPNADAYDPISGRLEWDLGSVESGSNVAIAFIVCVPSGTSPADQVIVNRFYASDGNQTEVSNTITTNVITSSQWEISKSVTSGPIYQDEDVTYQINVCNTGGQIGTQNLLSPVVTDMLPPGASFVNATPAPTTNDMMGNLTWDLPDLDVSDPCYTIDLVVTYSASDPSNDTGFNPGVSIDKTNNVDLDGELPSSDPMNPDLFNTSGSTTDPLLPPVFLLEVSKSPGDMGVLVFDSINVFAVTAGNAGTTTLDNFQVFDAIPDQFLLTSISSGSCVDPSSSVLYDLIINYAPRGIPPTPAAIMTITIADLSAAALTVTDITSLIDTSLFYVRDVTADYGTVPKEFVGCDLALTVTDAFIPLMASSTGYIDNVGDEVDYCIPYENCATIDADQTASFGGNALMQQVNCAEMLVQPRVARIDPAKTVVVDYIDPPIGVSTTGNPYFPNARVKYCVTFENDGDDDGVSSFAIMTDPLGVDILSDGITYDGNWWIDANNTGRSYDNSGTNPTINVENDMPNVGDTRFTWRFTDDFEVGDQVVICFNATIDDDQSMGTVLTNQFCLNSNSEIFCDETTFGKPSNFGMSASYDPMDFLPAADIIENDDICCKAVSITVRDSTAVPSIVKSVVNPGNFFPKGHESIPEFGTDTIIYEVALTNDDMANAVLPNPMIMDLLSDNVTYIPGSFEVVSNTTLLSIDDMGTNPGFVVTDDYNMTGRTLLKWNFAGDFGIGAGVTVRFKVSINAGEGGSVSNVAYAYTEDEFITCNNPVQDVNDLNGNSMTTEDLCASNTSASTIIIRASVTSSKFVKGPVDPNFLRFPDVATTYPGDTFRYKLSLVNTGNLDMDEFTLVDILPYIGDVGVRTGQPRGTEWRGWLDSLIGVPAGFTVFYSESSDPCRNVAPTDVNDSGPAGCDNNPMWTPTPLDLSAVQSFYIDFPPGYVLTPTDSVVFEFRMRAPSDGPPGQSCNSFAYRTERASDGQVFRAEPLLCCIQLELDTIGDYVWFDENADGIQDMTETPLENVTMALFDTLGNRLATTVTDVNGFYKFTSHLDANESWTSTPGLDQFVHPFTPYYVVAAYDLGASSGANNGDTLSYFPDFDIYLSPKDQGSLDNVDSDGAIGGSSDPMFLQGLIFDSVFTDVAMADYSHDFGFYPGAEIGDFVWFDVNMNGLQDAVEPGVEGVTVYLLDENMVRIVDPVSLDPISQITDANGYYSFEEIKADADSDTFFVEFALNNVMGLTPTPIQDSVINVGGAVDSELDSDLSLVPFGDGFKTDTIIILPGDSIPTIDAGVVGQDTIGDFVFEDVNGNGIQDSLDQPIANVKVYLFVNGTIVDSTMTNMDGIYLFPGLLFGPDFTYKVMFDNPSGYVPTLFNDPFMIGDESTESDADPDMMLMTETYNFTDPAFSYLDLDAGFVIPVSVGDTAWVDTNGNGIQDGEAPLQTVTVTLYQINPNTMMGQLVTQDALGNPIVPLETDADGRYKFENLFPGEYYVDFDVTTAVNGSLYFQTVENVNGTDLDSSDSDININGESDTTLVLSGGMDCTLDAGYFLPVSVGDTVWVDDNGNGVFDTGESGLEGVKVNLYKNVGGVWTLQTEDYNGGDLTHEFTLADGSYLIDSLMPGEYYVEFDVTSAINGSDYYTTYGNIGGMTLVNGDSDPDENMNSDTTLFLSSSESDFTLDAGYFLPVAIGDTAFVDSNLNGIQDNGEPGFPGIIATAYYFNPTTSLWEEVTSDLDGNLIEPDTTNEDGYYKFENLPPGQYYVEFNSGGIPPTLQDVGMDDLIDSDIDLAEHSDTLLVTSGTMDCSFDAGYVGLDYGDLPDSYVTTDANNMGGAPKHVIRDYKYLGQKIDQDIDGVPTPDGLGDDNAGSPYTAPDGQTGGDDEDGIQFLSPMIPGKVAYLKVTYTTPDSPAIDDAFLNGWMDFDGNGTFDPMTEAINFTEKDGVAITPTTNLGLAAAGTEAMVVLTFEVPETAAFASGIAVSRFRYSCVGGLTPDSGLVLDGEIEDYVTPLGKIGNLVWLDENFDGLQDPMAPEQTLAGVQVVITYDTTVNNQQISMIDTTITDENGLYSFCGLISSDDGKYQLTIITPDGLAASMPNQGDEQLDSDNDIEIGEEGRDSVQTFPFMITDVTNLPLNEAGQGDTPNVLNGYPDNQIDQTFDFGFVPLDFGDLPEMDFGDLPISYATTEDGNVDPPRHIVTSNKRLGACVDSELDGQPDEMGMGDDNNMDDTDDEFSFGDCTGGSDEDGIEFLTPLIPGDTAFIKITYTLPAPPTGNVAGYLNGWIDYNGDGLLTNADDQIDFFMTTGPAANLIRPNLNLVAGDDRMIIVGFPVPETASFNGGTVFSRFRLSCEGNLLPVGILQDGSIPEGEVEDYVKPLVKVGNLVWLDQNYDGIQDTSAISAEEGIPDVKVNITYTYVDVENDIDLTISVDTLTNKEGKYNFCGLLPNDVGEYKLTVISPEFFTPTVANNPLASDSLDSDNAVNMGDTIVMTDIFQITQSTGLPIMEDGLEDDPNMEGTFPDSLFDQTFDFGFVPLDYGDLDSSYVTAAEDGGPIHVITELKFLGRSVDAEITAAVDSIAGAISDGDDNAPGLTVPSDVSTNDDEDGIKFITPLVPGFKATISVDYTLEEEDGFLNGWIDFNGNGTFEAEEALVFYSDLITPSTDGELAMGTSQTIELCFDVPEDAVYNEGNAHARFRLSCDGGLSPVGGFPMPDPNGPQAPQGEVEDYFVPLAKIGNLAFFDNDLDGTQDGNTGVNPETGVEGVHNTLTFAGFGSSTFDDGDEIEYPVITDENGNYYVCGLIEGEYNLIPNKYLDGAENPEDTIPVRYVLTAANCNEDDDLDSDFAPNVLISIPNMLFIDLPTEEDGFTDNPGGEGFPDPQDQVNFDQGWIPEPNIEAIANIAGVDYPESGQCRNFNVIADVCIQNTGFVEMNGELIGARLENIDIEINLGEQFMGAFVGVVGDPIILDTVEYEEAFMLISDEDAPNENPDFDGNNDIDGSLMDGILEPSEIVCLRITFEISPDELSDEDAMNLQFNAVVSGMAINSEGKELPDFFNGGAQFVAVDSSDRIFMFDGTYDDPNEPEPLTNCYETTKDLSVQSSINLSYDENCMALITPQMVLTQMDENCDNDDYPLGGYYRLQLEDLNGNVLIPYTDSLKLDDPMFIGNMYNVSAQSVSEKCNSAWGKVTIENKVPPEILCVSDTISCGELLVLAPPIVLTNCGHVDLQLLSRTTQDVACDDPELQLVITETWVAVDPNGLRSDTCTQTLSVEKFNIEDIEGPMTTDTTLNCADGYMPAPEALGVPTLNGVPLYPDNFAECGIFVDFEDEFFSFENNCSSGVRRTWTVLNWICGTDNSTTFTQLITFVDTTGPVISNVPADMTVSTSGFECEAQVVIPAIGVADACNPDEIRVDINYQGGFQMDQNGATISLEAGTSVVEYIAYDVCGNSSTASFKVTVQDLEQPVTICDAFTTVSLNSEGKASLSASKLDNGSFDECGPVQLAIRRMDDDLGFMDQVDFTCADIGSEFIMVALRVSDVSGNANTCMAQVEIQDKLPPVLISGLPDITISCTFPFAMDNLNVFGTFVNDPDSIKPIVIDDDAVQFSGPAQDALILDNCSTAAMSEITSGDLDNCGNGTLIRTITATSPNGETTSLTQRITLVNPTPFVEADITWPDDITLNQCAGDGLNPLNFPDGQSIPIYEEDNCDMVSSTFEDKILSNTPNGGGCLVIERTWFVSDWCQRINNQFVIFENVQFITINNSVAPVITSDCEDIRVESLDPDCGTAAVTLVATATDDCVSQENLIWSFTLDYNSDGSIDNSGTGNDASDNYPVGVHEVHFTVSDGCGNFAECTYTFEVVNTKAATPICFDGLSTALEAMDLDDDGEVDGEFSMLTPAFIDAGSYHTCGYDLLLSFSADVNDTLITFNCDDLGIQTVELWVTDPTGNSDFCSAQVIVEDNNDYEFCPETAMLVDIFGTIYTEENQKVDKVTVLLDNSEFTDFTGEDGAFTFEKMPVGGDYNVVPKRDTEHMNGVSTIDLVMIQRHILGTQPLGTPYKLIAADVNGSAKITGSDLLALRKMILGLTDEFPNNTSWRFMDATHSFLDESNPWSEQLPETYPIYNLVTNMATDFIGVKTGDVNGSVLLNGSGGIEVRSAIEPLRFTFDQQMLREDQVIRVPIYANEIASVLGYQFTLEVNPRLGEIIEVVPLQEGFGKEHFGLRYAEDGLVTSSWNPAEGLNLDSALPMFELVVKAKSGGLLSEILELNDLITVSEAYSVEEELIDIQLRLRNEDADIGIIELYQNQPNPWTENTVIKFSLPKAENNLRLMIFDVTGKLIMEQNGAYGMGVHRVELHQEQFAARGVYYYELVADEWRLGKRMVLIK